MAERYDVVARIVSQKGTCTQGHRVGEEWVIGEKTPAGICLSAFNALCPNIRALKFGGAFPWETDSDVAIVACPDAKSPVVFELRRLQK